MRSTAQNFTSRINSFLYLTSTQYVSTSKILQLGDLWVLEEWSGLKTSVHCTLNHIYDKY